MTVQTSEADAAPSRHGHASGSGVDGEAHAMHDGRSVGAGAGPVAAIFALPRTVKIVGGAALGFGALVAIGVPLATLTPLVFLGGCLGMHLFMGHGMSHGGDHGAHATAGDAADRSQRSGG